MARQFHAFATPDEITTAVALTLRVIGGEGVHHMDGMVARIPADRHVAGHAAPHGRRYQRRRITGRRIDGAVS